MNGQPPFVRATNDYAACRRVFPGHSGGPEQRLRMTSLDGYGPLRLAPKLFPGDRVRCWAGTGELLDIHPPFNGVEGIHSYCTVLIDDRSKAPAKLDELELVDELTTDVDGRLF